MREDKMIDIQYAKAYKEVLEILKFVSTEDYNKIPKEQIEFFQNNSDKDYKYTYMPFKSLNEQDIMELTKYIIILLFKEYWATDLQKKKIIAKQEFDREKLEEEKTQKYNINDLFKNKKANILDEKKKNMQIIEYKEPNFYEKIIEKILKIFRRK